MSRFLEIVTVLVVLSLCLAILSVALDGRKSRKLTTHIDAKHNIICYTWKSEMECFPYHDEGTHLEITR